MLSRNFDEKVWELLKKIPRGRVTTYKELAKTLNTKAYRAVGQACGRNPYAPTVPCHRVVSSSGKIGGFSGDIRDKVRLLKKEDIKVKDNRIVDFNKVLFKFPSK